MNNTAVYDVNEKYAQYSYVNILHSFNSLSFKILNLGAKQNFTIIICNLK